MSVELAEEWNILNESKPEDFEQHVCKCEDKSTCACNNMEDTGDYDMTQCCDGTTCNDATCNDVLEEEEDEEEEELPEQQALSICEAFHVELLNIIEKARVNNLDYFVAGLLLATQFPYVAWMFLTYVFSIPTIIIITHPEWFTNNNQQDWISLSFIIGTCISSEVYAAQCLLKVLPIAIPY